MIKILSLSQDTYDALSTLKSSITSKLELDLISDVLNIRYDDIFTNLINASIRGYMNCYADLDGLERAVESMYDDIYSETAVSLEYQSLEFLSNPLNDIIKEYLPTSLMDDFKAGKLDSLLLLNLPDTSYYEDIVSSVTSMIIDYLPSVDEIYQVILTIEDANFIELNCGKVKVKSVHLTNNGMIIITR